MASFNGKKMSNFIAIDSESVLFQKYRDQLNEDIIRNISCRNRGGRREFNL